jgi:hypothetical protein
MSDLDELLETLKQSEPVKAEKEKDSSFELTDENLNEFILKQAKVLIETGVLSVEDARDIALSSGQPEDIEAFAALMKAATSAIDTLSKINIQNKKAEQQKEIEKMRLEGKAEERNQLPTGGGNNILIATREEVFRELFQKDEEEKEVIDIEYEDDSEE